MNKTSQRQTHIGTRVTVYIKSHKVSLGMFLAAYGAFYLSSVILSDWTVADWGKEATSYPPLFIDPLLPHNFINPIFFVTSFPALIIGSTMLCLYSIRGIRPGASIDKQYIAILLTTFGLTYQVIGAWPLGNPINFPWEWQKQIVFNGAPLAWTLYGLSLTALLVGIFSLYKHSKIFHQKEFELTS
jgi:hypothetical protein